MAPAVPTTAPAAGIAAGHDEADDDGSDDELRGTRRRVGARQRLGGTAAVQHPLVCRYKALSMAARGMKGRVWRRRPGTPPHAGAPRRKLIHFSVWTNCARRVSRLSHVCPLVFLCRLTTCPKMHTYKPFACSCVAVHPLPYLQAVGTNVQRWTMRH